MSPHAMRHQKRLNGRTAWNAENLAKLKAMCASHASYDDLNTVFAGFGMSTLLVGMRTVIAQMVEAE